MPENGGFEKEVRLFNFTNRLELNNQNFYSF